MQHSVVEILAVMVFAVAWLRFERSPTCVQCSGKLRHRADCPERRDGDA